MFKVELIQFLLARPELSAVVGARIYPSVLPQAAGMPSIVVQDVSNLANYSHNGNSGLDEMVLQFDCWAKSELEAKWLAVSLLGALEEFPERRGFKENQNGREDPETGLYREMLDVRFWARA